MSIERGGFRESDPKVGIEAQQNLHSNGQEVSQQSSANMQLPTDDSGTGQDVTFSSVKNESGILNNNSRNIENIKAIARTIFQKTLNVGSNIKTKIKNVIRRITEKLSKRSTKVDSNASILKVTKPESFAESVESDVLSSVSYQKAEPLEMTFERTGAHIREKLLDPKSTTEEKALFVFQETNMLMEHMAIEDPEIAQGGADLAIKNLERLARVIGQGPRSKVKSELDKPIDEQKLTSYINKTTLIDDRKRNMQIELDNDQKPNARVRGLRQEQINDFGVEDLAPNIMSTFVNLRKALN